MPLSEVLPPEGEDYQHWASSQPKYHIPTSAVSVINMTNEAQTARSSQDLGSMATALNLGSESSSSNSLSKSPATGSLRYSPHPEIYHPLTQSLSDAGIQREIIDSKPVDLQPRLGHTQNQGLSDYPTLVGPADLPNNYIEEWMLQNKGNHSTENRQRREKVQHSLLTVPPPSSNPFYTDFSNVRIKNHMNTAARKSPCDRPSEQQQHCSSIPSVKARGCNEMCDHLQPSPPLTPQPLKVSQMTNGQHDALPLRASTTVPLSSPPKDDQSVTKYIKALAILIPATEDLADLPRQLSRISSLFEEMHPCASAFVDEVANAKNLSKCDDPHSHRLSQIRQRQIKEKYADLAFRVRAEMTDFFERFWDGAGTVLNRLMDGHAELMGVLAEDTPRRT
ncbi:hypothetical protein MMC25_000571 [Agyrium rufum]|nr:hypothetical protein [Agyrium rufum]